MFFVRKVIGSIPVGHSDFFSVFNGRGMFFFFTSQN